MYGSRKLSKLESAIYVIVVSVVVLVMLDRMLAYFEYAERAAVESTLLRTQSALHTRLAYDRMRGSAPDLEAWRARNPFEVAHMQVANFGGERNAADTGSLEAGQWVYDRATRQLIYSPRYSRGLMIEGGASVLRFRLTVDRAGGLPRLTPVAHYSWEP